MNIYIIRHGQVPNNVRKIKIYNNDDEDLTNEGINQAINLREKIKQIDYDIIISSPLKRATQTAEIINIKNKEIIFDDRLKERNPGNLHHIPKNYVNREEYWNFNSKLQYGTSENMKNFFGRVYDFIEDLKKKNYKNVIIVSHSGVSKAFSAYFQGINDGKFLEHGLKNCEMKEYRLE